VALLATTAAAAPPGSAAAPASALERHAAARLAQELRAVRALEVEGRLEAASAAAESLWVRHGPGQGVAATALRIHRARKDTTAQRRLLDRWLATEPANPRACDALAELQLGAGERDQALATLRAIGGTGRAAALGQMARLMARHGFLEPALAAHRDARLRAADPHLYARDMARILERLGRAEEAGAELAGAWSARDAPRLRADLLGLERRAAGQIDLDTVAAIAGEGPALAARLALRRGQGERALQLLEGVESVPDDALPALLAAAETHARKVAGEVAPELLERLRALAGDDARRGALMLRHARILLDLGQLDAARRALERLEEGNTELSIEHAAAAGRLALESGRAGEALPWLRRAQTGAELPRPVQVAASIDLIEAHLALGDPGAAFAAAESLASADPTASESSAAARFLAAEARLHAGDSVAAVRRFRGLAVQAPGTEVANDALERVLMLQHLGVAAAPDSGGILAPFLAAERARLGRRHADAARAYQTCVDLLPELRAIAAALGAEAYRRAGDPGAGAALLERVIDAAPSATEAPRLALARALLLAEPAARAAALRRLVIDFPESSAADEARIELRGR